MRDTLPDGWGHLSETPGLPISWYLDPAVLEVEQRVLFDDGPGYVGHELVVPDDTSYQALPWDEGWALVRSGGEVRLVSNVCRHRQSVILEGRGHAKNLVCPLHRWSYDLAGRQLSARRFGGNPGRNLPTKTLRSWNGLLFTGPRDPAADLAGFSLAEEYAFEGFVYDRTWVEHYPINWKTFIEFYIELYHVEPFHPGLTSLIDCDRFSPADWELGDWWANQRVPLGADLSRSPSDKYLEYQKLVVDYRGREPRFGALWLAYYPNVMVEWYPEALIVSHVVPKAPDSTVNIVDFFYPADVVADRPEIIAAHQAAYIETAEEDGVIADHMDRGRRALHARGADDAGPYQHPLETGMAHFHDFVRRQVEPRLAGGAAPVELPARRLRTAR